MKFDRTGLEDYSRDEALERDGVWYRLPGGRELLIKRAGGSNTEFTRKVSQAIKPFKRQIDRGTLDNDVAEDLWRKVYSAHVIADWSGVKDDAGKPIPYSPEAGEEFLKAFPELMGELMDVASSRATFSAESVEEVVEELGNSSSGG